MPPPVVPPTFRPSSAKCVSTARSTMPSADSCPFTPPVTRRRAGRAPVGSGGSSTCFHVGLSPAPMNARPARGQASPDKNVSFPCTTAPFTPAPGSIGLRCLVPARHRAQASDDVSVRRLAGLFRASSRPHLAVTPLPFPSGSKFSILPHGTCTPLAHAHAGRTRELAPDELRSQVK